MRAALIITSTFVVACSGPVVDDRTDPEAGAPAAPAGEKADTGTATAQLTEAEAQCMLGVVNDCARPALFYDLDLGWDWRSADALLARRAGADLLCGTVDDVPLTSVEEIDALKYVGDADLMALHEHAVSTGCGVSDPLAFVEGVAFTAGEAKDTLAAANEAPAEELTTGAKLTPKVAGRIVAGRPYSVTSPVAGLVALGKVSGVGKKTLQRLLAFGGIWATSASHELVTQALELAKARLADRLAPPGARFRALLGTAGFGRLSALVLAEVGADLATSVPASSDPAALEPLVNAALEAALDQQRFLWPFESIAQTTGVPGSLTVAFHVAADALIAEAGATDFEATDVGASFTDLVSGGGEPFYLADVQAWRTGSPAVQVIATQMAWLLRGEFLGVGVDVTVSRTTGHALSVVMDL